MFVKADKGTTNNTNDKVMTPENVAKEIIKLLPLKPLETVLDPFYGKGAFYENYPNSVLKSWCEIDKGVDFFEYNIPVKWIISNPPYSILDAVLKHSFEIADNVCYLLPLSKIVSSLGRIDKIMNFGGAKHLWILSAGKCGFPFGFPACFIWIKKDYNGPLVIERLIS